MKRPKSVMGKGFSDFNHSFNIKQTLAAWSVLIIANLFYAQSVYAKTSSDLVANQDWFITFTTGRRMWAGTDSDIYVEVCHVLFISSHKYTHIQHNNESQK